MMIYYCFRNSIHVNTDVPKPYAHLCFKHMLFHMMLMHRYFLPRTHMPFPELQWLFGFSEMIYPGMGFPTVRQWSIRGWIQWWSEWCSLLNGHAGGGRKFPHDIAGFYPHQISMVFPWNPHQSLNPNHIHVLYIYICIHTSYNNIYIYIQTQHIRIKSYSIPHFTTCTDPSALRRAGSVSKCSDHRPWQPGGPGSAGNGFVMG